MKFLDKLKSIGLDFSRLRNISIFKLSVNIDKSVHVDASNACVTINPSLLTGKKRRALSRILAEDGLSECGAIVHERHLPVVEEVQSSMPAIQKDLDFFSPIIPPQDIPLLQACLYLRQKFQAHHQIEELKSQIVRVYGQRGRNFANLCSANYLDDWFRPMYTELQRVHATNPAQAREKFMEFYSSVLRDLPWSEFVCSRTSRAALTTSVVDKMNRNRQNGVRFLNLHGLGQENGKKMLAVLPEIQRQTGAVSVKIEQESTRTFVRLEIPDGSL